jgi:hypothetical protein
MATEAEEAHGDFQGQASPLYEMHVRLLLTSYAKVSMWYFLRILGTAVTSPLGLRSMAYMVKYTQSLL